MFKSDTGTRLLQSKCVILKFKFYRCQCFTHAAVSTTVIFALDAQNTIKRYNNEN